MLTGYKLVISCAQGMYAHDITITKISNIEIFIFFMFTHSGQHTKYTKICTIRKFPAIWNWFLNMHACLSHFRNINSYSCAWGDNITMSRNYSKPFIKIVVNSKYFKLVKCIKSGICNLWFCNSTTQFLLRDSAQVHYQLSAFVVRH